MLKVSLHTPHDLSLPLFFVFGDFCQFLKGFGVQGGFDVVVFCGVCEVLCDELDPGHWGSADRSLACGESNNTAELFVQVSLDLINGCDQGVLGVAF